MPQEATGQYLLMAYLSSLVRQAKGDLFTEIESGEGRLEGYLVVFHARPQVYGKLTHAQLEFTLKHKGYTIHVYLVRLGAIWKKKSQTQATR